MTDDRTEEALRRALQDAARQVNVPMGSLPEPAPEPVAVRRRRTDLRVPALVMLVLVLVAGSIVFVAARGGDGPSSITTFGAGAEPITGENADVAVFMSVDATDEQIAAVRSLVEESPDISAYTFLSRDDSYREFQALYACKPDLANSFNLADLPPVFRLRVGSVDAARSAALELSPRPGVDDAIVSARIAAGLPPTGASTAGPSTGGAPSSTVMLPSTTAVPAAAEPTTSLAGQPVDHDAFPTTVPASDSTSAPATTTSAPASKEIPFVAPAPADCTATTGGNVVQAVPNQVNRADAFLPPAGEQPADPSGAEQAIREMWMYTHDGSVSLEERFRDNLEDADKLLPLMKSIGRDGAVTTTHIIGIQFLSPTSAAVLSQNVFQGGTLDVAQVQYVALIDGRWKWTRESQCKAVARAGVHCPEGP